MAEVLLCLTHPPATATAIRHSAFSVAGPPPASIPISHRVAIHIIHKPPPGAMIRRAAGAARSAHRRHTRGYASGSPSGKISVVPFGQGIEAARTRMQIYSLVATRTGCMVHADPSITVHVSVRLAAEALRTKLRGGRARVWARRRCQAEIDRADVLSHLARRCHGAGPSQPDAWRQGVPCVLVCSRGIRPW